MPNVVPPPPHTHTLNLLLFSLSFPGGCTGLLPRGHPIFPEPCAAALLAHTKKHHFVQFSYP